MPEALIVFQVELDHDPPRIRATQGHTVQLEEPVLTPVTDPTQVTVAVHVTSKETWKIIQQDGFLRRMARTHIHFATKPVLARANTWANCFLQLDVGQALADGVNLYLSTNAVLLCEGPLPVKYVKEIKGFEEGEPPNK
jgi:2'-phosphotransferase